MEIDEAPIEGDTAPFPEDDAVMMICGRHPLSEKHQAPDQGWGMQKCKGMNLSSCTLTYVNIYMYIYVHHICAKSKKKEGKGAPGGMP
jgi:hypothetical protein